MRVTQRVSARRAAAIACWPSAEGAKPRRVCRVRRLREAENERWCFRTAFHSERAHIGRQGTSCADRHICWLACRTGVTGSVQARLCAFEANRMCPVLNVQLVWRMSMRDGKLPR